MNKQTIIKIAIVIVVGVLAIVYYFSNQQEESNYEEILNSAVVIENKVEEKVTTEEDTRIKVYIAGEVNIPGVIELEQGARIEDAIQNAGGVKPEANLKNINLAYEVSDGEKIYIPNVAEEEAEDETSVPSSNVSGTNSNTSGKININKATEAELTSIPGIGTSTAQKIITYREENGKFQTIEDIKKVSGIGDSKFESMKDYIAVK